MNKLFYLDLLSEDTSFLVKGKKGYRTNLGVLLSILMILASIIFTILFGQEIYQRKRPNVSISEEFLANSRVKMTEYPFYFTLTGYNGKMIEDYKKYYDVLTFKMNFTENLAIDYSGYTPFFPVVKCEKKHFNSVKGKISDLDIENILHTHSFCVEYNEEEGAVQNPIISINSTFLELSFHICNQTSRACAEDLSFMIKEMYFSIYLLNSYIDSNDYDNPVKYYYKTFSNQITDNVTKRNFISIHNNEFISDDGWILENYRRITYQSVGQITSEINNISPMSPLIVLRNCFDSPYLKTNVNRSYLKVQDLFAKIGGIVKSFMLIIQILFSHYFRYNFNMNLRNHLNPKDKNYHERRNINLQNILNNSKIACLYNNNIANLTENNKLYNIHTLNNDNNNKESRNANNNQQHKSFEENLHNNIENFNESSLIKKSFLFGSLNNKAERNIIDIQEKLKLKSINKNTVSTPNVIIRNSPIKNNFIKLEDKNKKEEDINIKKDLKTASQEEKYVERNDSIDDYYIQNPSNYENQSLFKFSYIDFSQLSYFKYLIYSLLCTKRIEIYQKIKDEVEHLLDFYVYCNYLKHQYLLKDPREFKE